MTDREALEDLLRRFGLAPYRTGQLEDGEPPDGYRPNIDLRENEVVLVAKAGGVKGYSGFHARFEFDVDGKFKSLGIWE